MENQDSRKTWEEVLHQHLESNLSNKSFTIADLARLMLVSERQLYRIVKDKMGVTPLEYLNHFRFQKAYNYLIQGTYKTVRETANAVGFRDVVYFARQFKNRFGLLPSEVE